MKTRTWVCGDSNIGRASLAKIKKKNCAAEPRKPHAPGSAAGEATTSDGATHAISNGADPATPEKDPAGRSRVCEW